MKCPYCLSEFNYYKVLKTQLNTQNFKCDKCDNVISPIMLHELKSNPYFTLGMVGFSNHEETVYLTSLFYLLEEVCMYHNFWSGFTFLPLDRSSFVVFKRVQALLKGQLPDATPEHFPKPYLIKFSNLPVAETVFTCIYDIGGEVYSDLDVIQEKAELIAKSDTLFFVISINDSEKWHDDIYSMLYRYIAYLRDKLGSYPMHQNLIFVFTKPDEIFERLPQDIQQSLMEGSYLKYKHLDYSLLEKLQRESEAIENWLMSENAAEFVSLAKASFNIVHFTMVSPFSLTSNQNRLANLIQPDDPKNILDPFLIALGNYIQFPGTPQKSVWKRIFDFVRK